MQLGTVSGIVVANAINVGTNKWVAGWRISLGLAAVPGTVLLLGEQHSLHPWCSFLFYSDPALSANNAFSSWVGCCFAVQHAA